MEFNFNNIVSYLTSPDIQQKLFGVKIGFLALGGFFLAVTIFCILKSHYFQWLFMQDLSEFLTFRPFGIKRVNRIWNKILKRLDTGSESEYKLAVVEADNMLDSSLKRMGYSGQALEERLSKLTSATLPNIEEVYEVHKICNTINRDPNFTLTLVEAKRILDIYGKAFNSLEILA